MYILLAEAHKALVLIAYSTTQEFRIHVTTQLYMMTMLILKINVPHMAKCQSHSLRGGSIVSQYNFYIMTGNLRKISYFLKKADPQL